MPQLKKVAVAMGNRLAYADTYEQALQDLITQTNSGVTRAEAATPMGAAAPSAGAAVASAPARTDTSKAAETLRQVQGHLQRYRELSSQGKWAEAGKELEQIQQLVNQ
jgi:uncharacterized membrane protein (UPF0182 family)